MTLLNELARIGSATEGKGKRYIYICIYVERERENDKGKWIKYNMQMRNIRVYISRVEISPFLLIKRTIGPVLRGEKAKPFRIFPLVSTLIRPTNERHHALNIRADRTRI